MSMKRYTNIGDYLFSIVVALLVVFSIILVVFSILIPVLMIAQYGF